MRKLLSIVGGMAAVAFLLAAPVQSEMISVSDSDLDTISGKMGHPVNTFDVGADQSSTTNVDGVANAVLNWYQWHDKHNTDDSQQKGANYFASETAGSDANGNQAQQYVLAQLNLISWGAASTIAVDTLDVTGTSDNRAYAIFANGGF